MTSHSGRTYLNTCLKVPIDPCNNCPAPVYNRPNMYLGRLSATPTTAVLTNHCDTEETDPKWTCSGIRSLAKFYDSIPDYGELNHLTEEEFYSTLDTLRTTCRELKVKSVNTCHVLEDRSSTTSSSLISTHCAHGQSRSKKSKKTKKKKKSSCSQGIRNNFESQESHYTRETVNTRTTNPEGLCYADETKTLDSLQTKGLKKDLDEEVESFKKSLKEFEAEFKRPTTSSLNRNESRSFTRCSSKEAIHKDGDKNQSEKVPVRTTFTSTLRERLRKSLSFNDLHSIPTTVELMELRNKNKTLEKLSFKGNYSSFQDANNLSNYFKETPKYEIASNIPKIIVNTPSTEQSTDRPYGGKKSKKKKNKIEDYKAPFKVFDLDDTTNKDPVQQSTPSPVHPVARPNLAATLRAESSKKKVKELKNNCTYHDTTPQIDWEVRKTPAWKTLSLNETHKDILSLRLATRKAEQALQQREYELNMELMRQRVKSAPLLLEGPTYWGPHVGKQTHTCQREARRHMCQSNQQRMRRKKNSSRSQSCRRSLFHNSSSALDYDNFDISVNAYRVQQESRISQKLNTLRKIYGGNSTKQTQSRCSNHSTNTQQSFKTQCKKKSAIEIKSARREHLTVENDSGEELSSLDRAFL